MYTKAKIEKLGVNNIVQKIDDWEFIKCFDYEGILAATIFNGKFTKSCLRIKEILNKYLKEGLKFPIYIIKNEQFKIFKQIEIIKDEEDLKEVFIFGSENFETVFRKKEKMPLSFLQQLPKIKVYNSDVFDLNDFSNFNYKFISKKDNIKIEKVTNYINNKCYKFSANKNDFYFQDRNIILNNINKNGELIKILLSSIKKEKVLEIYKKICNNERIIKI